MIYVDSSVILAEVLAEDTRPSPGFWMQRGLVSSRLAEYESWVRIQARGRVATHGAVLADRLGRVDLLALDDATCSRVRSPFPVAVRTLDAIHLATADFLRTQGFAPAVATYDVRMRTAALTMGFDVVDPSAAPTT